MYRIDSGAKSKLNYPWIKITDTSIVMLPSRWDIYGDIDVWINSDRIRRMKVANTDRRVKEVVHYVHRQ